MDIESIQAGPKGSVIVVRGGSPGPELEQDLGEALLKIAGHMEWVLVHLQAGTDLSVIHDPEAVKALTKS